ncbi:hydrophobin-domain-containing protein [Hymenopellis radicata]|nr:hydrophobin-domain-containing protein [Hymenopellis radicata]
MKFPTLTLAFLLFFACFVAAAPSVETNAQRLARGLPPNAPSKRYTPSENAKRHKPSGSPGQCNTGPVQCCNSVETTSKHPSSVLEIILGLLGIPLPAVGTLVGLNCSPISGLGLGGGRCSSHPVCCENNSHGGLISIGCIPSTPTLSIDSSMTIYFVILTFVETRTFITIVPY